MLTKDGATLGYLNHMLVTSKNRRPIAPPRFIPEPVEIVVSEKVESEEIRDKAGCVQVDSDNNGNVVPLRTYEARGLFFDTIG
jgi:hypothetical protein